MSTFNTIRAWKDEDYRLGLGQAELALLPEHQAGISELSDAQLDQINGGTLFVPVLLTVAAYAGGFAAGWYGMKHVLG